MRPYFLVLVISVAGFVSAAETGPLSVEERLPKDQQAAATSSATPAAASNSASPQASSATAGAAGVYELVLQIEQLQNEIASLRGQLEEQQAEMLTAKEEQRLRYLDLDRRINKLAEAQAKQPTPAANQPNTEQQSSAAAVPVADKPKGPLNDKQLYDLGRDRLKNKEYVSAMEPFQKIIDTYPDSDFVPYAHYWLGELLMALDEPNLEKAKDHFRQVVKHYPTHEKMPATLFKLGKVQHLLGDDSTAKLTLKRLQIQYPESESAKLAGNYLQQMNQ